MRWAVLAAALLVCCQETPARDATATPHEAAETNRVVLYIKGAEAQFETPEQGSELRRALNDLSTLPPLALCARRYADYGLTANQWTLVELLQHYVVPDPLQTIPDAAAFCTDAAKPAARAAVRAFIRSLDASEQR
jgi:hypothetical protein